MSGGPEGGRVWSRGPGEPAWIIAHRGDSCRAPENTLEAARLGHEAGADAWELDVRLTRDGIPVLIHDASLFRTTDVARRFRGDPRGAAGFLVEDFDLEEVRRLDAGGWFVDPGGGPRSAAAFATLDRLDRAARDAYAAGSVRVPTLAEALALTRDLDWAVNVELKSDASGDPALGRAVLEEVGRAGVAGRVLVSSFDHEEVAGLVLREPGMATGLLTTSPLHDPEGYLRGAGADAYHPSAAALGAEAGGGRRSARARAFEAHGLARLRRAGVPTFVFTVNDAAPGGLADQLAEAGVAGVFTDDPAALAARWRPGHARRG